MSTTPVVSLYKLPIAPGPCYVEGAGQNPIPSVDQLYRLHYTVQDYQRYLEQIPPESFLLGDRDDIFNKTQPYTVVKATGSEQAKQIEGLLNQSGIRYYKTTPSDRKEELQALIRPVTAGIRLVANAITELGQLGQDQVSGSTIEWDPTWIADLAESWKHTLNHFSQVAATVEKSAKQLIETHPNWKEIRPIIHLNLEPLD
jgi:hypothetical protein